MRKVLLLLAAGSCAAILVLSLTPASRVNHQSSSAYTASLFSAVRSLESGGRAALGATAIMLNATAPAALAQVGTITSQPLMSTCDGRYTCETYDPAKPGCRAQPTSAPALHTCFVAYTCQRFTCETYDPKQFTCDVNESHCTPRAQHTTEPAPGYNHTCDPVICGPGYTYDQTLDPRSYTCDAADPACKKPTFNKDFTTCDPQVPQCRPNNPGACTVRPTNPTCSSPATCPVYTSDPRAVTCDNSPTCSAADPACPTDIKTTTWGKAKAKYRR